MALLVPVDFAMGFTVLFVKKKNGCLRRPYFHEELLDRELYAKFSNLIVVLSSGYSKSTFLGIIVSCRRHHYGFIKADEKGLRNVCVTDERHVENFEEYDILPVPLGKANVVDEALSRVGASMRFRVSLPHATDIEAHKGRRDIYLTPLVEELVSDDKLEKKIIFPTVAKIEFVRPKQQEKLVRKPVKYAKMYRSQSPRGNQRNWNNQKSQQLGINFVMYNKACFICGSFDLRAAGSSTKRNQGYVDSGCSRHMTGNMSYLSASRNFVQGIEFFRVKFCKKKGIKKKFSVARTPQQNGVVERRNKTLIEATKTMLADSKLPTTFWAEAVNTACYVQNRVLVCEQTRRMTKTTNEQGFISAVYEGKTHKDLHTCLFACFLSQEEPKRIAKALRWIEECFSFMLDFKEGVYVCQTPGFEDHGHIQKKSPRYLKGQPKLGLWYPKDSPFELVSYSDSDYAGASLDRKSTTGGCQFLGYDLSEKSSILCFSHQKFGLNAMPKKIGITGEIEITATIDGKVEIVTEASVRRHFQLAYSDGISSLPTIEIFKQLSLMGSPTQTPVTDEAASTSVDVRYEGATTTVTSLEAGQELQGRYGQDMEFEFDFDAAKEVSTADLDVSTAEPVSTAGVVVTIANVFLRTALGSTRRSLELEIILSASCVYREGTRHLHAGREGVSIVKGNSYIDAGHKALGIDLKLGSTPALEDYIIFDFIRDDEDDGVVADMNNLDTTIQVSSNPTTRIYKDHPLDQVIGDLQSATQTRRMSKNLEEHGRTQKGNSCIKGSKLDRGYAGRASTIQTWTLVDLPNEKRAIGTKWVFRNKKDERGIMIRNKTRLVAQGYTQEERIDYDEVFDPIARIDAIRLFLAYASFKDFVVYQMDVKSVFLYGKIKEEVYQKKDGIFISQDKYVFEILKKFRFTNAKTASTPMETQKPLLKDKNDVEVDVHMYRYQVNPKGTSFTQGTIPSIPIGGSISPKGFLLPVLLLVVMVVIVIVILIVILVDDVSLILKLSFVIIGWAYAFYQDRASSVKFLVFATGAPVGLVFLLGLLALATIASCAFRAKEMPSVISCWMAAKVMAGV
ncbi:putative ribonuclease H-like domain-containing protein [Tanacetum coccineum]